MYELLICSPTQRELKPLWESFHARELEIISGLITKEFVWGDKKILTCILGPGPISTLFSLGQLLAHITPKRAILVGIAGSMPGSSLKIGDVVISKEESLWEAMGLWEVEGLSEEVLNLPQKLYASEYAKSLGRLMQVREVSMLTVLVPSKDKKEAQKREEISASECENMEGYAFFWALKRRDILGAQVRVISNVAGERDKGKWEVEGAV
ncbi:MAG: hypothetical protein ACK4WB_04340, partial [Desulfatiglandales bacterium]